MRIALISHQPLWVKGGISVHIKQLAEAMNKLGCHIEVVVPQYKYNHMDMDKNNTLSEDIQLKELIVNSKCETARVLEYAYRVYKYITTNMKEYDAIHGSQWSTFFLSLYKSKVCLPIITKFHGTYVYGTLCRLLVSGGRLLFHSIGTISVLPVYALIETTIAKRSDGLIFINHSVKKEVEMLLRTKLSKNTCVIYNGVDTSKFRPRDKHKLRQEYGLREDDKVMLFVGRLDPLKGVHRLTVAVRRIIRKDPKVKMLIVGEGEYSYVRYLKSIAIPRKNFMFLGWVPHNRLPDIYNLADLFISPSPYSSGNNVLEAMSCGIPVIAVKGFGFEELIKHGKTGFVIDNVHVEKKLEEIISKILYDEELLTKIGRQAREFIVNNLSWEKTAKRTLDFIKHILSDSEKR